MEEFVNEEGDKLRERRYIGERGRLSRQFISY
jgi:hypothetical protein